MKDTISEPLRDQFINTRENKWKENMTSERNKDKNRKKEQTKTNSTIHKRKKKKRSDSLLETKHMERETEKG
jgi:hypothetical protein